MTDHALSPTRTTIPVITSVMTCQYPVNPAASHTSCLPIGMAFARLLAAKSICLCAAVSGHPLLVGSTAGSDPGQALL